tara:strand:+ start:574 stop:744 length:171 start_codon:yes stop_codon:yes gene_type:complete
MEEVLIAGIILSTMLCVYFLLARNLEGTKGISNEMYYGRKTGKRYSAKKMRQDHIV